MAVAGMAATFVGVSPTLSVTSELRARTTMAASAYESQVPYASSASQFRGQRFVTPSSFQEITTRSATAGTRAYTATDEHTREGFTSGSGKPVAVTMSLYESLGVSRTATLKEIKAAYRLAARRLHPDVVPADQRNDATKAFVEIQKTYAILSDPQRRVAYDLSLSMQAFQTAGYGNRGPVTITPDWGFSSTPISSPNSYPSASSFSFKGRRWETDQCW